VTDLKGLESPSPFMNSIDEHIRKDQAEIEKARAEGDQGKLRHLEEELQGLKE
jgi:hypothetical protein